ncbi:MAG TPA: sulfate ABC transporter substrate-binding protein [Hyphomonadaceae bacterium]|nr:sulfate ABC transporter substrate-binding protein [Hyphomonadaceae bacterium]HPN05859.1 sulfate ABC transporter substrate-binding protein [Hyphomonadaceae bacterium]
MRLKLIAMAASLALAACGGQSSSSNEISLLNVSYDPTRELYEEFNKEFSATYKTPEGKTVKVNMSHGGSGKQTRSVIDGLDADVVTLALQNDIDQIAKETGKIPADWRAKLPANSSPYTSTIVFLVRAGNPKNIKDWNDLTLPGVGVITPNPKTSGGARWNYLAAWAYASKQFNGDEAKVKQFVGAIYKNVLKLDSGARGSTVTFTQQGTGDVLITWENEGYLTLDEQGADKYQIVYPSLSIKAEPPVAVVVGNAEKKGPEQLAAAEAYLKHLYEPVGQKIAAKHYYRPNDPSAADPADVARFQPVEMVTIDDPLFGGWPQAQPKHFDDGGIYDQIFTAR